MQKWNLSAARRILGWRRLFNFLLKILPTALLVFFLVILRDILQSYNLDDVMRELKNAETQRITLALVFTLTNYFVFTFYDAIGFQLLNKKVDFSYLSLTAFLSYAFSNTLGFSVLSGGATRYRLYSYIGITAGEVAQILAFNAIHFWMGLFLLAGLTCFMNPVSAAQAFDVDIVHAYIAGLSFLLPIAAYLIATTIRRSPVRILSWEIPVPTTGVTLTGLLIAGVDWFLAGATLYCVLPPVGPEAFPQVLSAFLIAMAAGVLTHVPGGIGVFETVIIVSLRDVYPGPSILSALILFRVIYYLVPFALAVVLFGATELRRRKVFFRSILDKQRHAVWILLSVVVPPVLAASTFIGGSILLFSGATPTAEDRLWWVHTAPLFLIETSHFISSVTGVGLLVLAWSILKRIDAAYKVTLILLELGIVVSIAKGFDYEEALYLSFIMLMLIPCRRYFYRKAVLFSEISPGFILAVLVIFGSTIYLGFFSYRHVEYSNQLWWQFSFEDHAPRFLRSTVLVMLFAMAIGLVRALKPARPVVDVPSEEDYVHIERCIQTSDKTSSGLAFLRDKYFLFNEEKTGFVMYGIRGRSWVAAGDPVGPPDVRRELVWAFREFVDTHDGWCVFYQVSKSDLPNYIDVGLELYKVGEEATLRLDRFSLRGPAYKSFRSTSRKLQKEGFKFEVVPVLSVPGIMEEIRGISDEWLAAKNVKEKGFSMGWFNEEYIARTSVGIVTRDGKIYAFANILVSGTRKELSVDLMRYSKTAPNGVMDFLFTQLMRWGRDHEYKKFNLGMAPLSGLENRLLAPLWNRAGALIYSYGENFYNFDGLYRYKDKFSPAWEPKYIACNASLALPKVLADIAALISSGKVWSAETGPAKKVTPADPSW